MVADRSKIPLPASMLSRNTTGGRQNGQPTTLPKVNGKPAAKRRGFGLFSDDEDEAEETEAESSRLSVSFSGNKSGFEELGKAKGNGRMSVDGAGLFDSFMTPLVVVAFPCFVRENMRDTFCCVSTRCMLTGAKKKVNTGDANELRENQTSTHRSLKLWLPRSQLIIHLNNRSLPATPVTPSSRPRSARAVSLTATPPIPLPLPELSNARRLPKTLPLPKRRTN